MTRCIATNAETSRWRQYLASSVLFTFSQLTISYILISSFHLLGLTSDIIPVNCTYFQNYLHIFVRYVCSIESTFGQKGLYKQTAVLTVK
jgi:hypothetical protein